MDTNTAALIEVVKQLGLAAPLVVALIYLLRQSEQREQRAATERKETGERYMTTLSTVISDNRLAIERMTVAVVELTTTIREFSAQNRDEHRGMMDAIGKANITPRKEAS